MGRVVRVTDPEEAVRLFEAGMLYWHYAGVGVVPLGPVWEPHNIRDEVKFYPSRHCLVYIVEEDEECDSTTTESED